MSYSGGLQHGYAQLMQSNGIPLYPGVGPETGFKHRCKLRPHKKGTLRQIDIHRALDELWLTTTDFEWLHIPNMDWLADELVIRE